MRPIRWLRRGVALVGLGVAGGALVVTARHLLETPQPLESGLPGEGRIDRKHGGDVYYTLLGPEQAQPVVLLHDFYPGASNYEYRHVFPRFAIDYRVYAPDWLGFGMSEHPVVAYTGEFYANMLAGFLRDVVGRPAILVASGRAANIAVRVASDVPELAERLVLISPYIEAGIDLEPTVGQALARGAQRTSLGLVPYAVLSARSALRFTRHARAARAGGPDEVEASLDHLYASAHQFGGQHALLALMTGELDLPIQNAFALLEPPVLVVGGERDPRHTPEDLEDLAILNPHADLEIVPDAGPSPFEDHPAFFAERTRDWLQTERLRSEPGAVDYLPPLADDEPVALAEPVVVVVVDEPTEADIAEVQDSELDAEQPAATDEVVEVTVISLPDVTDEAAEADEAMEDSADETDTTPMAAVTTAATDESVTATNETADAATDASDAAESDLPTPVSDEREADATADLDETLVIPAPEYETDAEAEDAEPEAEAAASRETPSEQDVPASDDEADDTAEDAAQASEPIDEIVAEETEESGDAGMSDAPTTPESAQPAAQAEAATSLDRPASPTAPAARSNSQTSSRQTTRGVDARTKPSSGEGARKRPASKARGGSQGENGRKRSARRPQR